MGEWRHSTWGEEISLEYGKGIRGYKDSDGPYRVYGSNGPVGWTTDALAPGPGVILGRKGAYRGVQYSPEPFFVIDTAYYVKPKSDLNMRWLYYAIVYHKLGEIDDGSPIPSTTRAAVYVRDFEIPPRNEQDGIADVLGALDDKIELNRQTNETLEAMARAIFKDWFVDFGPTRAKAEGRAPYLAQELWDLFPDALDDDDKPEGWSLRPASELFEFNPRESLKKGTNAPYLEMAALPTNGPTAGVPTEREYKSGSKFRDGDTLFARITPCLENGKTAHVFGLGDAVIGAGSTEFIVMRSRKPMPPFASYLLARDPDFRAHAERSMTGTSGRQRANADSLSRYEVTAPTDERFWKALGALIDPMVAKVIANAYESRILAEMRDILLPKLMSGEIRLAEAEKAVEDIA